ncbi:MAG: thioredoxin domain-containing protein [Armatimonadetes bacterium]|nr:thioredoxin domain-containing protein [Armatimonadota bacterium]
MRQEWANRTVFFCACAGIFVAGVLSVAHIWGASLPCGEAQAGCDEIARSPYSRLLRVPVAVYGLVLYLFLALAAAHRSAQGLHETVRVGRVVWLATAAGTLVSALLILLARIHLDAVCYWCLASAAAITGCFVAQTFGMLGRRATAETKLPPLLYGALLFASLSGAGAYSAWLLRTHGASPAEMVADSVGRLALGSPRHVFGREDAPITIVEFTDFYCPKCREEHAWLMQALSGELAQDVRLVLRHRPWRSHRLSVEAAILAEWAADQGRFWEFADHAYRIESDLSLDQLFDAAEGAGLDVERARAVLNDSELRRAYFRQVNGDIQLADELGVRVTPSWFVILPDGHTEFMTGDAIRTYVQSPEFRGHLGAE